MVSTSTTARDKQALMRPTYQNRLRVIGLHLDVGRFHSASVFEIEGGFIVRALPNDVRRPQALEFPDSQFQQLMQSAINDRGQGQNYRSHPSVLPTGYADFFRSLGFLLDNQMASSVMICELTSYVLVTGQEPSNSSSGHMAVKPFERYLRPDDIQLLLNDAFGRRTNTPKRGILGIF